MGEQLFRLKGEEGDLEELAYCFEAGNATVKKFDDFHYLVLQTDGATSDDELRAAGEAALKRMNAICLVRDGRFRFPSISGLSRRDPATGKISTVVNAQCHIQVRSGVRAKLTLFNPDGTSRPRQPTFGEQAYRVAETNEALREALRTYGAIDQDWRGLYTVFETIEAAKGKIPSAWATKGEISDFTGTANSYCAVGPDARHGFGASEPMVPKMTVAQARALIQKLLQAWVDELIGAL